MEEHQKLCHINIQKAWMEIQPFVQELTKIAYSHSLQLDMVGSFATTLWLPYSDMDFILVPF